MISLIILLLALDLRVNGSDHPGLYTLTVILSDSNKCPKVKEPLCGTNGKEFMYFENKCYMEVKNYELLTQGFHEYYECPLSWCQFAPINDPIFTIEEFSQNKELDSIAAYDKEEIVMKSHEGGTEPIQNSKPLTASDCPEYCTLEHRPICARFVTLEKEFLNECELRQTICQTHQNWQIIKEGHCFESPVNRKHAECPEFCESDYQPLCAEFKGEQREFHNLCELTRTLCKSNEAWDILNWGHCLANSKDNADWQLLTTEAKGSCAILCTSEFRPVCAHSNGQFKEFFNSCELDKHNCETQSNWELLNRGSCPQNVGENKVQDPICANDGYNTRTFDNVGQLEQKTELKAICTKGNTSPTANSYDDSRDTKPDETAKGYKTTAFSGTTAEHKSAEAEMTTKRPEKTSIMIYSSNDKHKQKKDKKQFNKHKEVEGNNQVSLKYSSDSGLEYKKMSGDWTEKKLNTTQTVKNDIYSQVKRASVKEKNSIFNYEGYSKEDDESIEIYSKEIKGTKPTYNDSLATIYSKPDRNYSVKNDTNEEIKMENMIKKNQLLDENEHKLMLKSNEITSKATEPYQTKLSSGNNSTTTMRGEIYNGAVYKAPVYDAPTYNFILTAPIPGLANPVLNYSNTFSNQSIPEANTSISFHPLHFLSSLASATNSWAKTNLMTPNNATTSNKNLHADFDKFKDFFHSPVGNQSQRQRLPPSSFFEPLLRPKALSELPSILHQAVPQTPTHQYFSPPLQQQFMTPAQLNERSFGKTLLNSTLV